jgi:MFS family permease
MVSRGFAYFKPFRGFSPDAKKLVFASGIAAVGDATVWFLLTLYLNFLEFSRPQIGSVIFIMSIFQVMPLLPAGYLADRFGRRRMIFLGICIYSVGIWLLLQASSLSDFYIGAAIWGYGHALYMPAFMSFLSEKVESDRCKFLFGLQMFASMISSATAVLIMGFMPVALGNYLNTTVQNGYRYIFFMGLCFCLFQLVPLIMTEKEKVMGNPDDPKKSKKDSDIPPLPKKILVKLCVPMALFGLGAGLIVPFFQVWFQWRFNTTVEDIGILWSLTQYLWAAAYLVTPALAERKGSVKSITLVHTAAIIALLAIPVSPTFFFVSIAYITRMVLMNSTWPIFQSYSLSQVPDEHRSFTLSSTNFSFNSMKAITPLVAGYLFEFSLQLPFFITAVLYIIGTIAFYMFFKRKDDRRSEPKINLDNHQEP